MTLLDPAVAARPFRLAERFHPSCNNDHDSDLSCAEVTLDVDVATATLFLFFFFRYSID